MSDQPSAEAVRHEKYPTFHEILSGTGAQSLSGYEANGRPEFSVITCSIDDRRFGDMKRCHEAALSGESYEIIRITDATGLAEGYRRGVEQSRGRIIIFSHDDAAPLRPIGATLRNHLRRVDVVGVVGTDRLDSPLWFSSGPPFTFGQILHRVPSFPERQLPGIPLYGLSVFGVPAALVMGIQAVDGLWFAANRESLSRVNFDPDMCPGFHMYDVDFSFRAYLAGLRVGVGCDLFLRHYPTSKGYVDANWKPQADRWMERYGKMLSPRIARLSSNIAIHSDSPDDLIPLMSQFVERTR